MNEPTDEEVNEFTQLVEGFCATISPIMVALAEMCVSKTGVSRHLAMGALGEAMVISGSHAMLRGMNAASVESKAEIEKYIRKLANYGDAVGKN